jgi:hypothetical protein
MSWWFSISLKPSLWTFSLQEEKILNSKWPPSCEKMQSGPVCLSWQHCWDSHYCWGSGLQCQYGQGERCFYSLRRLLANWEYKMPPWIQTLPVTWDLITNQFGHRQTEWRDGEIQFTDLRNTLIHTAHNPKVASWLRKEDSHSELSGHWVHLWDREWNTDKNNTKAHKSDTCFIRISVLRSHVGGNFFCRQSYLIIDTCTLGLIFIRVVAFYII